MDSPSSKYKRMESEFFNKALVLISCFTVAATISAYVYWRNEVNKVYSPPSNKVEQSVPFNDLEKRVDEFKNKVNPEVLDSASHDSRSLENNWCENRDYFALEAIDYFIRN